MGIVKKTLKPVCYEHKGIAFKVYSSLRFAFDSVDFQLVNKVSQRFIQLNVGCLAVEH